MCKNWRALTHHIFAMQWIAPPEKDVATTTLEKRLWDAADQFRANSGLKPQEYSGPILGLIFLRFAEVRFAVLRAKPKPLAAPPAVPVLPAVCSAARPLPDPSALS